MENLWWYIHLLLGGIHFFLGVFFLVTYRDLIEATTSDVGMFTPARVNITDSLDVAREGPTDTHAWSPGKSRILKRHLGACRLIEVQNTKWCSIVWWLLSRGFLISGRVS